MVDYGYGDGTPDVAHQTNADPYGYGDAKPDTDKYGYGDAAPDGEYQAGYNDDSKGDSKMRRYKRDGNESDDNMSTSSSNGSVDSSGQPKPRAHRPRRRNSVTRYSLVANEEAATVAREHTDNEKRIEQFRKGILNGQGLDMVPGSNVPHYSGGIDGAPPGDVGSSAHYTSEADRILQQQLEDTDEPEQMRESSRALSSTSSASGEETDDDDAHGAANGRKKGGRLKRGMRAIGRRFSVGA